MNEPAATSPIIMALFFVLRCLIPLGLLFGISYLLRRLELVIDRSDEASAETDENMPKPPVVPEPKVTDSKKKQSPKKKLSPKKKISGGKKKSSATSKKKKES